VFIDTRPLLRAIFYNGVNNEVRSCNRRIDAMGDQRISAIEWCNNIIFRSRDGLRRHDRGLSVSCPIMATANEANQFAQAESAKRKAMNTD
jgi:hypothetical protein